MRHASLELLLVLVACGMFSNLSAGADSRMAFPGAKWEEASPESQGLDCDKLAAAVGYLKEHTGRDGVNELVIVRNGRIVWKGSDIDKVHGVWSVTKSFTSTATGLLVDDGKCTVKSKAKDFLPALSANYPNVTLEHFLTMASGYRAVGDEPRGGYLHGPSTTPFTPNSVPLFTPPGSRYAYWDSAMNQFAQVLTRIAGEPLKELFKRRIADPIGMDRARWDWGDFGKLDGVIVNGGSGNMDQHIRLSARELARLGHLFLNRGQWNGKRLISEAWIDQATRVHVPASTPWAQPESKIDGRGVYGYNWWVNGICPDGSRKWSGAPAGTFAASGHNNNKMFVVPDWNMVVVRLGLDQGDGAISDEVSSSFLKKIGESVLGEGNKTASTNSSSAPSTDPRDIRNGLVIPDEGYCDQPYVVVTKDGNWLCTLTTGPGVEGQKGQHVVSTISTDKGRTWSPLVDIEPSNGPEASWVVPLVVPSGRVYAFYTYNGDRVDTLRGKKIRADTFGWYAFKYSDDNGRSWSAERFRLPLRATACDRGNDWQGGVQMFWGIDKPKTAGGQAIFAFTKLGRYMLEDGEGWLFRSDNVLTESDPNKLRWEMLPEGEHGIRAAEFGSVQEEHNAVPLSDGSMYCVYRTTTGYPCHTYSKDGGRTWLKPEPMTYTPGGRKIENPRACPKLWRTADGRYLFWFHNHNSRSYHGRNPAWLLGGIEKDGRIHWSQPEIAIYDAEPNGRMSYPDLIEQDGHYWITETQKTIARVHEIDKSLLEGMWKAARPADTANGARDSVTRDGPVLELKGEALRKPVDLPQAIDLSVCGGITIDVWLRLNEVTADHILVDSRGADGRGFALTATATGTIRIELNDGKSKAGWECEPGRIQPGKLHHVNAIVDAGPQIISFVVDGSFCDGGAVREYGWHRYEGRIGDVSGQRRLKLAPSFPGDLKSVRLYNRPLRTSEAIANPDH